MQYMEKNRVPGENWSTQKKPPVKIEKPGENQSTH